MKQATLHDRDSFIKECDCILKILDMETDEYQSLVSAIEFLGTESLDDVTPDDFKRIVRRESNQKGVEFATCLVYAYWLSTPKTRWLVRNFAESRIHNQLPVRTTSIHPPEIVYIVPGALYKEYPATGADGQILIDLFSKLGIQTQRVPLKSDGRLIENTRILHDFFRTQRCRNAILVSLSKGSSDLKFAMRDSPALLDSISLWVNIAGTLSGTPLIQWVRDRPVVDWINRLSFRLRGRDYRFFTELQRLEGGQLDFPLSLPNHLQAIHITAVPLRRHARTRYAKYSHHCFSKWGPNDGALMLEDLIGLPGDILPIWGADHYCGPRWDFQALTNVILRYWEEHVVHD